MNSRRSGSLRGPASGVIRSGFGSSVSANARRTRRGGSFAGSQGGERWRHAVRRDEKRWLIPSYDGNSSDAIEDAQASGVSEPVDRLFHRAARRAKAAETAARASTTPRGLIGRAASLNAPRKTQTTLKTPSGVKRFDLLDGHRPGWVVTLKPIIGSPSSSLEVETCGSICEMGRPCYSMLERGEAPHEHLV